MGEDLRAGTAEIGYWLGEPFWGRGIATAAVAAFTAHAFADLGLRRVFARVLEWNPASARVLEKCGYALEGRLRRSALKDGKVADELLYARLPE
jgi:RimJ/RimL family protein N-acetyltransferase